MHGRRLLTAFSDAAFCGLAVLVFWTAASIAAGQCGPGGCPAPGGWGVPQGPSFGPSAPSPATPAPSQYFGSNDKALYPFACRIEAAGRGGSGSYVETQHERHGIVLTAAHVIGSATSAVCHFPNGESFEARPIHKDTQADIAALAIAKPRNVTPVRLADTPPKESERVTLIGYGGRPRKGFLARGGFLKQIGQRRATIAGASSHGDSGGGVLDARGRLVAVICATDPSYASETYVALYGPIRGFLGMPPRYQYQMQHGLPPYGTQRTPQQNPGGGRYVPPQLPDTSDLVTRDEYERDKSQLMGVLREADLLSDDLAAVKDQVDQVDAKATEAAAEATESRSLIDRVKERLGGLEGNLVRIDGKIAGVVDTEDFLQLAGQFKQTRAELIDENSTLKERIAADLAAAKKTIADNRDAIKTEALGAAEEVVKKKVPGIPWGLIFTALGLATGGTGFGVAGIITALVKRKGGDVAEKLVARLAERLGD